MDRTVSASRRHEDTERLGKWGEDLAADYLKGLGFKIVGRRVKAGRGEIDLIALYHDVKRTYVSFVEVKTRRYVLYGGPLGAVDRRKRRALCKAAIAFLRHTPRPCPRFQFDIVAIVGAPDSALPPAIRYVPNAFHLPERVIPASI